MRFVPFLLLLGLLPACTQFPELDGVTSDVAENADYPTLLPLDPLMQSTSLPNADAEETEAELQARVAALQARAARLRGQVVDPETRRRLSEDAG